MTRRHVRRCVAVLVAVLLVTACASDGPDAAPPEPAAGLSAAEMQQARQMLVTRDELPQLTMQTQAIDRQDLVGLADAEGVAERLAADSYRGGAERTFRGPSREITGAESRVLVFATETGAASFAEYLAGDPDPFFGGPSVVTPLDVGSSEGALIEPPMCDCPGAHPLYVGVVAVSERVLWLQLTGPKANPARLRALLAASADRG